jgi:tetratricopeptide (TPR) repeat protein
VYTSNEGRFAFSGLVSNVYTVVVNLEGYLPARQQASIDTDFVETRTVQIILRPRHKPESEAPPERVSGGNPHLVDAADYDKRFPSKVVKEFKAGVRADRDGEKDKAIRHYRKTLELAPDFYPALNNLGSLYLSQKDFGAAEAAFSEVIKLNQTDANAYFNLGNVLFLTESFQDAERVLREGLSRDPRSALGHYLLGSVQARQGAFSEAEGSLQRAISLGPEMSNVRLELVNLYLAQQRTDEAIRELETFVDLFPNDAMMARVKEVLAELTKVPTP